jgi:peptidyl-prolyl cis-trans isomerase D
MMSTLRKNMKVILWIVVIAFVGTIFFVWGMDLGRQKDFVANQSAAMVNGHPISNEEFDRLWTQEQQSLYAQSKEEPTREQTQKMRQNLVSDLIDRELLRQRFTKLGFSVFPEEVAARISSISAFQQNGKFSQERYLTLLTYNHLNPDEFENSEKQSLAVLKMEMFVKNGIQVTDGELRTYFNARSRELKLKAVIFDWKSAAKALTVPEAEVADYYDRHHKDFDEPAEVKAAHILLRLDPKATEEQKLTAKLKIENIRNEITKQGMPFAEAAKKYSEDPGSAKTGGDLGFFKAGMMVPAFEKAAFALKPGELSQPVLSDFGYHLIKVAERKEAKHLSLGDVRKKISDQLKETKAREAMQKAATKFVDRLLANKNLLTAAQETKTPVISTDWVKVDGKIPGVEKAAAILDRAFNLPLQKPSSTISQGDTIAFVQAQEEKWLPFDENTFAVSHDALLEKLKNLKAEQTVAEWLTQAKAEAKIVNNIEKEKNETDPKK